MKLMTERTNDRATSSPWRRWAARALLVSATVALVIGITCSPIVPIVETSFGSEPYEAQAPTDGSVKILRTKLSLVKWCADHVGGEHISPGDKFTVSTGQALFSEWANSLNWQTSPLSDIEEAISLHRTGAIDLSNDSQWPGMAIGSVRYIDIDTNGELENDYKYKGKLTLAAAIEGYNDLDFTDGGERGVRLVLTAVNYNEYAGYYVNAIGNLNAPAEAGWKYSASKQKALVTWIGEKLPTDFGNLLRDCTVETYEGGNTMVTSTERLWLPGTLEYPRKRLSSDGNVTEIYEPHTTITRDNQGNLTGKWTGNTLNMPQYALSAFWTRALKNATVSDRCEAGAWFDHAFKQGGSNEGYVKYLSRDSVLWPDNTLHFANYGFAGYGSESGYANTATACHLMMICGL